MVLNGKPFISVIDRHILIDCVVSSYGFDYALVSALPIESIYAFWCNISTFFSLRNQGAKSTLIMKISTMSESEARNVLELLEAYFHN